MAGETPITVIGNLTADPELRFTNSGAAVASFTVASTPRTFNRQTNQWEDGTAMFLRCSAWRSIAENCAESLKKGMRVIVTGRLTQNNWESRDGERRSSLEIQVDEIGPSLRYATANVQRNEPSQSSYGGGNQGGYDQSRSGWGGNNNSGYQGPQGGSSDDAWAQAPAPQGSAFDRSNDAPPF